MCDHYQLFVLGHMCGSLSGMSVLQLIIKMIFKQIVTLSQTWVPRSSMLCCVTDQDLAELLQKNKVRRGQAEAGRRPVEGSGQ